MAFDPKKDYTAAISKTKDPAEKARLEAEKAEKVASIKSAGLDYTKASDIASYNKSYESVLKSGGQTSGTVAPPPTTVIPPPMYQPVIPQVPQVDYAAMLAQAEARAKQLEEQRINVGIAGLQKAKQSALTGISGQRQQLPEQTRAGITQTRVISDQARKQMRDYFAQRFGESASGSQAQADIAQNVAQQGAETQYNLQEQAQMAELARREADINAGYESDVASIRAGAQADTMANILARQQQLQGLEASQSLANQQLQYQEGLRTQEQQREDALKTIDRDYSDLTAGINRIKNDNDPSNDWLIPYYETRRSEKLQTIEEQKKADAETQRKEAIRIQEQQAKLERQIYDDAVRKWSSGIPLTASEMQMLGVKTATKPKPKTSSGGSKTPVKPLW